MKTNEPIEREHELILVGGKDGRRRVTSVYAYCARDALLILGYKPDEYAGLDLMRNDTWTSGRGNGDYYLITTK